jgi:hypothetical protein
VLDGIVERTLANIDGALGVERADIVAGGAA